jgi:ABC-type branched-subunit amino acid transport system substrate-binding protein
MTERRDRRDILKAAAVAGALGLAGCVGGDDDGGENGSENGGENGGEAGGEINLGLVMGVTGDLENLGPPIRDGAQAVAEQINDADSDWTVSTQFEDTETTPQTGVDGAQAVVDAGNPMFVGALASTVSLDIADAVTLEEGVVQMSPASTAVNYSTLDEDLDTTFTWRTTPSDAFQGPVAANIALDRLGVESVSTVARDDAYGRGLANAFVDAFEEGGGTVQSEVLIDPSRESFTADLQTALGNDPDMLYVVAFPGEGQFLFRDFYESFNRPELPILVSDGLQDAALPGDAGQDIETFSNVAGTGPGISDDVASGLDAYQERVDDGIFVRESYDAAAVLSLARAAAGSDDAAEIAGSIRDVTSGGGTEVTAGNLVEGIETAGRGEAVEYQGVSRPLEFDENGDVSTPVYEYFDWTTDDQGEPALNTIDIVVDD